MIKNFNHAKSLNVRWNVILNLTYYNMCVTKQICIKSDLKFVDFSEIYKFIKF